MKTIKLLVVFSSLTLATLARSTEQTPVVPAPPSTTIINAASSISDLATGYAAAASQMSESHIVVYYRSEEKTVTLKGIRSVRAFGGVLLIHLTSGDLLAISAERILLITDGGRTP